MHLGPDQIMLWIVALLVLEVMHLRWIWYEHWHCRRCHAVNRHCSCGRAERIMRL